MTRDTSYNNLSMTQDARSNRKNISQKENYNYVNLKKEILKKRAQKMINPEVKKKDSDSDEIKSKLNQKEAQLYFQLNNQMLQNVSNLLKNKDFTFLRKAGSFLNTVVKNLSSGDDTYDGIRFYNEVAQDPRFQFLEETFCYKSARNLFSQIFKLERWSLVVLFYLTVEPIFNLRLEAETKSLLDLILKNHFLQLNWLKLSLERIRLSPDLIDPERIYINIVDKEYSLIYLVKQNVKNSKKKLAKM